MLRVKSFLHLFIISRRCCTCVGGKYQGVLKGIGLSYFLLLDTPFECGVTVFLSFQTPHLVDFIKGSFPSLEASRLWGCRRRRWAKMKRREEQQGRLRLIKADYQKQRRRAERASR